MLSSFELFMNTQRNFSNDYFKVKKMKHKFSNSNKLRQKNYSINLTLCILKTKTHH